LAQRRGGKLELEVYLPVRLPPSSPLELTRTILRSLPVQLSRRAENLLQVVVSAADPKVFATMPSTIPYDPSLVLGAVIRKETLENIEKIAKIQATPDAAKEHLSSLVTAKRSLDTTKTELMQLGLEKDNAAMVELDSQMTKLKANITQAATTIAL
jgi:hypothetical protein